MKILHSAALLHPPPGILNQMMWEQKSAHQLNIDWDVRMFCPSGWTKDSEIIQFSQKVTEKSKKSWLEKLCDWVILRREYYDWLTFQEKNFDLFVLRYYVHDPFQLKFISNCKKPVYLVHHTLEVPELASTDCLIGKTRAIFDEKIGFYTIRKAVAIIGVTQEIIDYEKKRSGKPNKKEILYPNGIMYDQPPIGDNRGDVPELLFVSSYFSPWHGLDLLLNSVKKSKKEFRVHLVGELSKKDRELAENDKRVVLHGQKNHQEIHQLAEQCCLGLSSFALHRNNMTQACTLKVREYLMMGLAVYAGYQEIFPQNFPFYYQGSPNIDEILQFSNKIYNISRKEISKTSRPFIEKTILLENLFNTIFENERKN